MRRARAASKSADVSTFAKTAGSSAVTEMVSLTTLRRSRFAPSAPERNMSFGKKRRGHRTGLRCSSVGFNEVKAAAGFGARFVPAYLECIATLLGRLRHLRQEPNGRHDLSRLAITALGHVECDPRRPHRLRHLVGRPFNRSDLGD